MAQKINIFMVAVMLCATSLTSLIKGPAVSGPVDVSVTTRSWKSAKLAGVTCTDTLTVRLAGGKELCTINCKKIGNKLYSSVEHNRDISESFTCSYADNNVGIDFSTSFEAYSEVYIEVVIDGKSRVLQFYLNPEEPQQFGMTERYYESTITNSDNQSSEESATATAPNSECKENEGTNCSKMFIALYFTGVFTPILPLLITVIIRFRCRIWMKVKSMFHLWKFSKSHTSGIELRSISSAKSDIKKENDNESKEQARINSLIGIAEVELDCERVNSPLLRKIDAEIHRAPSLSRQSSFQPASSTHAEEQDLQEQNQNFNILNEMVANVASSSGLIPIPHGPETVSIKTKITEAQPDHQEITLVEKEKPYEDLTNPAGKLFIHRLSKQKTRNENDADVDGLGDDDGDQEDDSHSRLLDPSPVICYNAISQKEPHRDGRRPRTDVPKLHKCESLSNEQNQSGVGPMNNERLNRKSPRTVNIEVDQGQINDVLNQIPEGYSVYLKIMPNGIPGNDRRSQASLGLDDTSMSVLPSENTTCKGGVGLVSENRAVMRNKANSSRDIESIMVQKELRRQKNIQSNGGLSVADSSEIETGLQAGSRRK